MSDSEAAIISSKGWKSSVIRSKVNENLIKKKELWKYLKKKDYKTYMKIRYGILGQTMNLPGKSGRKVSSMAYSVARRLIGFN